MRWTGKWLPWGVLVIASGLLVAHALKWASIRVDSVTLALLGLLLAIPLLDYVRKIRIGEFEAELAPREVAQTRARVEDELPPEEAAGEEEAESILALVRRDPQLGLAQVRIKLEEALRNLYRLVEGTDESSRPLGLARLAYELGTKGAIQPPVASAIRDVLPLANRAVHGEYVRQEDAEQIATLGVRLLTELRHAYRERLVQPVRRRIISDDERDTAEGAKYRVKTIVPLLDEPYELEYILNQEGLDELLEGYSEHAEFITHVEKIDSDDTEQHQ